MPRSDWPTRRTIPHPYVRVAAKIGLFLLAWGQIDQELDGDLVLARAGTADEGRYLDASFGKRLKEWRGHFQAGFPADPDEVDVFFTLLEQINQLRNDLAHNVRGVGDMPEASATWLNVLRPRRHLTRDLRLWRQTPVPRGDPPSHYEAERIPEEDLDRAMACVADLAHCLRLYGARAREQHFARAQAMHGLSP